MKSTSGAAPAFPGGPGRVAILIPCFNERATIGKVVRDFRASLPEALVVVYDNGSSDGSRGEAEAAGALVGDEPRKGKGHVIRAMFRDIEAEVYVLVDGDDTYSAKDAGRLLAPIAEGRADMVVGSRLAQDSGESFRPLNLIGNWMFTRLFNLLFGARISDTLSGYRALSRNLVRSLRLDSGGFDIETEINIGAVEGGFRIAEVSLPYFRRPEGSQSKLNAFRDGFRVLMRILLGSPRGRRRVMAAAAILAAALAAAAWLAGR